MSLELSLTEWFGPILCGKVQKLWPIIKLLRQEGITKLQKGKKRLNAFDLYPSFLASKWPSLWLYIFAFFDSSEEADLYLPFCQRMPSMGYPDAGQETATVRPSMALTGGIWRTCGGPANNNRKSPNALHHYCQPAARSLLAFLSATIP